MLVVMTERKTPTYDLMEIKKTFDSPNKLVMTYSAKQGQFDLNFSNDDVVGAIQSLIEKDFYKSMPPKLQAFIAWHDVYKTHFNELNLYIKFQVNDRKELILSFKER